MNLSVRHLWKIVSRLLVGAALLLAWQVRDQPWQPAAFDGLVRVDALSAFFMLLTLLGITTLAAENKGFLPLILPTVAFVAAYITTNISLLCFGFLLGTLLTSFGQPVRSRTTFVLSLLPSVLLAFGWAITYFLGGIERYDAANAGVALNSWAFVLILLATTLGSQPLVQAALPRWCIEALSSFARRTPDAALASPIPVRTTTIWAVGWLYPLLRLYSLGPWNAGWSFGTLLLGCVVALWCASLAASAQTTIARASAASGGLVGLSLACAGLSSAAGIVACCVALVCALLLQSGLSDERPLPQPVGTISLWLLSGALPITLPFIAIWLGMSAAAAGGVLLATGAFWLVGLGNALAVLRLLVAERSAALSSISTVPRSLLQSRSLAAIASIVLGIVAPALIQWLFLPVARQLQGGLSPYGDPVVWPWIGLTVVDSARQQVSLLPSLAVAGLMLVLCALTWLLSRLLLSNDQ